MQKELEKLIEKNNGIVKAVEASQVGIDNKVLQRLTAAGEIERVNRGLYIGADYMADELRIAQLRCPKGIFSYDTALYLQGLSDRKPLKLTMTIPSGYNTRLLKDKDKYKFYYSNADLYKMGITSVKTSFGNDVEVYNKERTICDCIKKKQSLDIDLVISALKQYIAELGNDYALLLEYAAKLKIRDAVKQYLEVLS